jgi:hypothetical protein
MLMSPRKVPANPLDASWSQALPWWWRQPPALKSQPPPAWRVVLPPLRPPVWPVVVAALLALGLLLAFHQVVAQVVVQADQQRAATLALHEIVWNCKLLQEPRERDGCLAQVSAAHQLRSRPGQRVPEVTAIADAGRSGRRGNPTTQALDEVFEE